MTILTRASEWTKSSARPLRQFHAANPAHHYFAFLSYSHRDEATADWLHGQLEKFRVPQHLVGRITEHGPIPRRLTPIFRDLRELPASDDLGSEIREALAASRFLIVLCSPAAAESRWTNAEIETFKRRRPDGCILAAVVAGEPFASDIPGREHEECLPRALRFKYDRRGKATAKRAEPLAADLREAGESRRVGFLKLVAGMVGVGLDELIQREALRRQRRLGLVAAASLVGMVVTSGLAVTAIQARDEARDQRREAEGLMGFMLGDLRSKLEPVGRLDALDGVGARVLEYYREQDQSELSDSALRQRSRALALMGEIAYLRGDLDTGLRLYREAMAGTAEAVERDPDDPNRLFDHAQNVFWVGEIARTRGQIQQAEAVSREYKRLAERMVAIEPDNMKWRMEVQYASANLGIVLLAQRRFAEAARQFSQALETIQSLATADAKNAAYQKSLSETLAWLADARSAEGRLGEALALRQRQVELLERLMEDGNGDVAFRQKAIPAHQAAGLLLAATGEAEPALRHLRIAVAHADRLVPLEPTNTKWQDFAAAARLALAEHLLNSRNLEQARAQTERGCQAVQRLVARDRSVLAWHDSLRKCLSMRAQLAFAGGSYAQALETARRAMELDKPDQNDGPALLETAKLHRVAGDAYQRMGNLRSARAEWQLALGRFPRGVPERPAEMASRAVLLERLGRTAEARPLIARLEAIGFRKV